MERSGLVDALVGVRAEEVALGLDEIRGQALAPVAVVVRERGGEGRNGNAEARGLADHATPTLLADTHGIGEVGREEQIRKVGLRIIGFFDPIQEAGADDAAAAPDRRDFAGI